MPIAQRGDGNPQVEIEVSWNLPAPTLDVNEQSKITKHLELLTDFVPDVAVVRMKSFEFVRERVSF